MKVRLDLAELFLENFGVAPAEFELDDVQGDVPTKRLVRSDLGMPYYKIDSVLGVEYFMPVTCRYTTAGGENKIYDLPFPMISLSSRKMVVETPLVERRGTVKQLIQTGDYDIAIKGLIIDPNNDFPEGQVTALAEYFETNKAVELRCALTEIFLLRGDRKGSRQAVVKELVLPGRPGVKHVVPYELKLVSDEPFNLRLVK